MTLRRHWKPLLAVAVVLLAALVYVGQDRWRHRCGAEVSTLTADDVGRVLQPRERISGADAGLLAALDDLPSPFGPVVAGRVFTGSVSRPTVGAVGDDRVFLASGGSLIGTEYDGQVAVADVATGRGRWGVGVRGYGAGGGPVGDLFVTLGIPVGRAPQLAAYDLDSGERVGCTTLGEDAESGLDPALGSTRVGGDDGDEVVVAQEDAERRGRLELRRIDPRTGEERWRRSVEQVGREAVLHDAGRVVVASGYAGRDSLSAFGVQPGQVLGLSALDARSGEPAWTWPREAPTGQGLQAKVVGADAEAGRVYALVRTQTREPDRARARVVALDDEGAELWSRDLPADHCDAAVWDDVVVAACGRPALLGLDAATGVPRWTTPQVLESPLPIALSAQRALDLGDGTRLQTAGDGLYRVDTASGRATAVATKEGLGTYVADVEAVGDHLVLSTERGVFVLERE